MQQAEEHVNVILSDMHFVMTMSQSHDDIIYLFRMAQLNTLYIKIYTRFLFSEVLIRFNFIFHQLGVYLVFAPDQCLYTTSK